MADRYPGYDVLSKRDTPSWNAATRRAVDERLAVRDEPRFFAADDWTTLKALCARVLPQAPEHARVPLAAYVDKKLHDDRRDGWRRASMPPQREAWPRTLRALNAEAQAACGRAFHELDAPAQDRLIDAMARGTLSHPAWGGMPPQHVFTDRVAPDIVRAFYAHPFAWNEIGFGGPASPRGYVRLDFGRRDPWEAAEATSGREAKAARENARVGR